MEKRKVFTRLGVAVAGFLGVLTLAAFRGPPGHRGGGPGGPEGFFFGPRLERMLDDVNATQQQRDQIQAIAKQLREKGQALRQGHQQDQQQLVAKFEAGQLDRDTILAQVNRHADQMKAFGGDVADAVVQVQGILTPEQRTKLADQMRRHMQRMQRGPGQPPPPPAPAPATPQK